jgi:tetratricopeptide (TPR) repeat protein
MRVVFVCLSLLLAFTPVAGLRARAQSNAHARSDALALQKAERWLAQGKTERAVRGLARELRLQNEARGALRPQSSDALLVRYAELALPFVLPEGEAQEKARRDAAELFVSALTRRAQYEDTLPPALALAAAWAEALRGNYADSQALVARYARADDPHTLPCLRALAALALRTQHTDVARSVLTLARGFAPADAELASELGLVALADGDTETALTALAERFARDPSSLLARRDLSYGLSAAGRPAEAFALLGVVGALCGKDASCLLERARWAFEAGLISQALAAARVLLEREPQHLDGLFLAADALLAQGELEQARLMYESILQIAPGNLRAKNALSGLEDSVNRGP